MSSFHDSVSQPLLLATQTSVQPIVNDVFLQGFVYWLVSMLIYAIFLKYQNKNVPKKEIDTLKTSQSNSKFKNSFFWLKNLIWPSIESSNLDTSNSYFSDISFAVYFFSLTSFFALSFLSFIHRIIPLTQTYLGQYNLFLQILIDGAKYSIMFILAIAISKFTLIVIAKAHGIDKSHTDRENFKKRLLKESSETYSKINTIYELQKIQNPNIKYLSEIFGYAYKLIGRNQNGSSLAKKINIIISTDSSLLLTPNNNMFTYAFMIAQDKWSSDKIETQKTLQTSLIDLPDKNNTALIKFSELFYEACNTAKETATSINVVLQNKINPTADFIGKGITPVKNYYVVRILFFDPYHFSHHYNIFNPLFQSNLLNGDQILNILVPLEQKQYFDINDWTQNKDSDILQRFFPPSQDIHNLITECSRELDCQLSHPSDLHDDLLCIGDQLTITHSNSYIYFDDNKYTGKILKGEEIIADNDNEKQIVMQRKARSDFLNSLLFVYMALHSKSLFLFKDMMDMMQETGGNDIEIVAQHVSSVIKELHNSKSTITTNTLIQTSFLKDKISFLEQQLLDNSIPDNWSIGDPDDDGPCMIYINA